MLQRVGIAQALINDPELVIFDEPMSGLDPLGRRDVRALILRLRDRGCTVFFSSHVLSDAEALCSRVAILAQGRLMTVGRLSEMLAFQRARLGAGRRRRAGSRCSRRCRSRATRVTRIGDDRYTFELPLDPPPDRLLSPSCPPAGRTLVSLNPLRDTLEDFFVEQVSAPEALDARPRPRPSTVAGGRAMRAIGLIAAQRVSRIGPRQGALQPGRLRDPADRRVVPDRPAHRRAGRQDHQGPRPRRDLGLRTVHRRSSSASDWCRRKWRSAASTACWPSRSSAISWCSASTPACVLTLAVNLVGDGGRALRGARLHGVGGTDSDGGRLGASGARSAAAQGVRR